MWSVTARDGVTGEQDARPMVGGQRAPCRGRKVRVLWLRWAVQPRPPRGGSCRKASFRRAHEVGQDSPEARFRVRVAQLVQGVQQQVGRDAGSVGVGGAALQFGSDDMG
ncbi:hypothetical protein CBQ26_00565 [Deinococcus indicus]|uniref:Uncharacterized protein n=1 Tax=Deinococcus indicus TaxID=223556 RepID=A0A246BTI4_9DEIO|nr:hypothetical protein CBQ26_00565 [Deinococcus indicus]